MIITVEPKSDDTVIPTFPSLLRHLQALTGLLPYTIRRTADRGSGRRHFAVHVSPLGLVLHVLNIVLFVFNLAYFHRFPVSQTEKPIIAWKNYLTVILLCTTTVCHWLVVWLSWCRCGRMVVALDRVERQFAACAARQQVRAAAVDGGARRLRCCGMWWPVLVGVLAFGYVPAYLVVHYLWVNPTGMQHFSLLMFEYIVPLLNRQALLLQFVYAVWQLQCYEVRLNGLLEQVLAGAKIE